MIKTIEIALVLQILLSIRYYRLNQIIHIVETIHMQMTFLFLEIHCNNCNTMASAITNQGLRENKGGADNLDSSSDYL